MPSKLRLDRIADRIREELSEMIVMRINDPRLSGIFITGVKVDRELAYAEIFVSAIEGQDRATEVLEGLEHASGFLRHALAQTIELRVFPRLRFHWDPTPERADRIERILASLHSEPQNPPTDEKSTDIEDLQEE
jgi:ribosome-binding factor A